MAIRTSVNRSFIHPDSYRDFSPSKKRKRPILLPRQGALLYSLNLQLFLRKLFFNIVESFDNVGQFAEQHARAQPVFVVLHGRAYNGSAFGGDVGVEARLCANMSAVGNADVWRKAYLATAHTVAANLC